MKVIHRNKGFSYVEMLVVIGIMSIMTGFIALTIGTVNRNNVRRAAESIESKLNEARVAAMSKGTQKGYLVIARHGSNIYTYVGNAIDPATGTVYTAEEISKRGSKLCSSQVNIEIDDAKLNDEVGNVLYIQFKQSTGGVNSYTGDGGSPKSRLIVSVKNQKNTMTSSFKVYKQTGKVKSE